MDLQLVVQDNNTGKLHDISELVSDVTWETYLDDQPGKLSFRFIRPENNTAYFYEGSPVYLRTEDHDLFYGYVFTKKRDQTQIITVTAYDQMRYLKNKDTYTFSDMTSSDIFKKLCEDFQLRYQVVDASSYIIDKVNHDNKALASMIQDALDKTLAYAKQRYIVRDNYGVLEHVELSRLRTNLVIGDKMLLNGYTYETTIDSDVYNQIKLIRENQETAKRDVYIVQDSANIKRWGILQYHESMDENANEAQIIEKAENLLSLYNGVRRTLKLECLGDFRVTAGTGLLLYIQDLGDINLNQNCTVISCKHKLQNNLHLMTLEVDLWLANG